MASRVRDAATTLALDTRTCAAWSASDRATALACVRAAEAALAQARAHLLVAARDTGELERPGDRSFEGALGRSTRAGVVEAGRLVRQADTLTSMPAVAAAVRDLLVPLTHLDTLAKVAASRDPRGRRPATVPGRSGARGDPGAEPVRTRLRHITGPVRRREGPRRGGGRLRSPTPRKVPEHLHPVPRCVPQRPPRRPRRRNTADRPGPHGPTPRARPHPQPSPRRRIDPARRTRLHRDHATTATTATRPRRARGHQPRGSGGPHHDRGRRRRHRAEHRATHQPSARRAPSPDRTCPCSSPPRPTSNSCATNTPSTPQPIAARERGKAEAAAEEEMEVMTSW